MFSIRSIITALALAALLATAGRSSALAKDPPADGLLPVAELKRNKPVSFSKEVLPILKKNCLACHNASEAESQLSLETPQAILKGGDNGPAAVAKHGADSLLIVRARGGGDGIMPPEDNKVAARPLTPEELALVKLWIDQGAIADNAALAETIHWQPLPPGVNPIYAVALSGDGQFAACGRANQIFVYQLPTARVLGRLTDPALLKMGLYKQPGVADLDLIQSLAFSPDGSTLASGGFRSAKLWTKSRDRRLHASKIEAGAKQPLAAISPDGKQIATSTTDHKIVLRDVATGATLKTLAAHAVPIVALSFSSDSKLLASAADDRTIVLWRLPEGVVAGKIAATEKLTSVALLDAGKTLAAGGAAGKVYVWNEPLSEAGAKSKPHELAGHKKPVAGLVGIPSQPAQLVSFDADGLMIVWDAKAAKQVRQLNHGGPVAAVAVHPRGERLASAGRNKLTRLWNLADGKMVAELRGDLRARQHAAELARSVSASKQIATAEKAAVAEAEKAVTTEAENVKKSIEARTTAEKTLADKSVAAKKAADEKAAAEKKLAEAKQAFERAEELGKKSAAAVAAAETELKQQTAAAAQAKAAAAKKKDDKKLTEAAAAAQKQVADSTARVATLKKELTTANQALAKAKAAVAPATTAFTQKEKAATEAKTALDSAETAKTSAVRAVSAAERAAEKAKTKVPEAQKSLAAALERTAAAEKVAAAATAAATATEQPFTSVAFSADGLQLATGNAAGLVHTWASATGAALDAFDGSAPIEAVAFAGDRPLVSLAADRHLVVWDSIPAWTWTATLGQSPAGFVDRVTALGFSPDGKLLATGGGAPSRSGEVKVWDVSRRAVVLDLPDAHSDTVFGVEFSPDGRWLATCAADKFIKIFELPSGRFVRAFEGHTHHVLGVSWSADGNTLASCGADNVVKIWDVATGEQKRSIAGFSKEVTAVHFVGDTPNLLATSGDKSVRLVRSTDGATVRAFSGAEDYLYTGAASPDGSIIIAAGQDSVLREWNGASGQSLGSFGPDAAAPAK